MREKLQHIFLVLTSAEKRKFWMQILLNVLLSIADIGSLALLLLVINFYINNVANSYLAFLPDWVLDRKSVSLVAFFFIVFAIKNLLGILILSAQNEFNRQVAVRISLNKLERYQQASFTEFIDIDSSVHIRKIALHPFEFSQHVLAGMQQVIIQSVLILLTIVAILLYNPQLFFFLLVLLLPPVGIVFFYMRRRLAVTRKNIQLSNERSFQYLLDALKGYVESNIYQRNDFFLNRFTAARQAFSKYLFNSISLQNMPARLIETFAVLGLFVLILIAKWTYVNDSSTLITIGAFMAAAYKIIPGLVRVINSYGLMKAYEFSMEDLEKAEEKITISGNREEALQSIQFRNIDFQYKDQAVLKDFSMACMKGDFIGITGRSGKGKTTILNLLLGFLAPKKGEILVNDHRFSSDEIRNYWPKISYVRQQSFFIHDSILQNITLQQAGHDKVRLENALRISGLCDFIRQSPEGLDKIITENGRNISGGQQQRIAIARALYKNADLVLLDEPFNELDESSSLNLVQEFRDMANSGKIVIMITHDRKCLNYCNKIVSLDES